MPHITLGDLKIDVTYKDIKNVHLSVYPPSGKVRISAPLRLDLDTIRIYAISRLGWIRKQQAKLNEQAREPAREYISRESHYYLGKRYLLKIVEIDGAPKITLKHSVIEMQIRPDTPTEKREVILDDWYRQRMKEIVPAFIHTWERTLNVDVRDFGIKKMKTKWGSCNRKAGRIWLNLELAKKPRSCIEYVVVHEMVHLLERKHGEKFTFHMDNFLPMWKSLKEELNRSPLSHQEWDY
ncbi:MAG: metal-dependent hydrolase [Dehalococcoides mccartyi]|uniref:M48 family metallopeptidase n=1 Tax=Dehalococcoides mccartyi TaxID=61435 RepID=UPI0029DDD9E8|nr:metal-dependent hydrolase [Dehalococcoides mccartyi]